MVKKKRGRPRKYAPEGQVSLGLSPMPSSSSCASNKAKDSSAVTDPNAPKRARGRPPGTGRKQRLANLGQIFFFLHLSRTYDYVIRLEYVVFISKLYLCLD